MLFFLGISTGLIDLETLRRTACCTGDASWSLYPSKSALVATDLLFTCLGLTDIELLLGRVAVGGSGEGERDIDKETLFCRTTGAGESEADLELVLFFVLVRALCTGGGGEGGESEDDLRFIALLFLAGEVGDDRCFLLVTVTFLGGDTDESDVEGCRCFLDCATCGGSGELELEL